jgi:hypothetical protein
MRFLLVAALALATCGGATESRAGGYIQTHHHKKRFHFYHEPRSSFFPFGIGGHLFGGEDTPYIYHTPYSYSPYFNNQTFWERVQTQPLDPVQ